MPQQLVFPRQLGLELDATQEQTFANFLPGTNAPVCDMLRTSHPLHYGYNNSVYLWSPLSSGKSHLLRAYCFYWQKQGVRIDYVDSETATGKRFNLSSSGRAAGLAIDNIQLLRAGSYEEEALLSFLKESAELDRILLISCDKMPAKLRHLSEDLVTRLMSFYVFQLHPLKGDLLKSFIRKRAKKLGVSLNRQVETLLLHNCMEQDIKFAGELLTRLATSDHPLSADRIEKEIAVMRH